MIDLNKEKLKLNYPCNWKYKIVVLETINIKTVVTDVVSQREHKVNESNVSKKGKFKSYTLELLVHSDDDRKGLYENLGNHDDIKMVL
ncbi:YbeD family protein [Arcobacter sp. YIC-310]|uniref:HP0495 family protein n=1 Tax=Arcobacter sp. YIC-310 TaxID=3376632 RepID=UPI003C204A6A